MTDPKRWSEAEGVASPFEQLLVRSGQDLAMPFDQKAGTWQRIRCAIPLLASPSGPGIDNSGPGIDSSVARPASPRIPAAPGPAAGGSPAKHGSMLTGPMALKVLGLIIATGGVGTLVHHLGMASSHVAPVVPRSVATTSGAESSVPVTTVDATALASESSNAPMVPPSSAPSKAPALNEASRSSPQAATRSSTSAVSSASPPSRASQLRAESQATLAIRQALRSNDVPMALKLLERAQQQFGVGALNEEREALMIEALARSGNRVQASKLAKAFLIAHPRSPHASDVRRHTAE